MDLSSLLDFVRDSEKYRDLVSDLRANGSRSLGVIRAARPYVAAALARDSGLPTLIITARTDRAQDLSQQLVAWLPTLRVLNFAEPAAIFYQNAPWGKESIRSRMQVLAGCVSGLGPNSVVVASARSLMQRTIATDEMVQHTITLSSGGKLPYASAELAIQTWMAIGYEPVTVVTEPGTFSKRGGILDIFPVADEKPVRIELWGTAIESMREFDAATQRSEVQRSSLTVTPSREALPVHGPRVADEVRNWIERKKSGGNWVPLPSQLEEVEKLAQGQVFSTIETYLPFMYRDTASLIDYLAGDFLVLVEDWDELRNTVTDFEAQAEGLRQSSEAANEIPDSLPIPLIPWVQLQDELTGREPIELAGKADASSVLSGDFTSSSRFGGQLKAFLTGLRKLTESGSDTTIVVSSQAERLADLWNETLNKPRIKSSDSIFHSTEYPCLVQGVLQEGWALTAGNLTLNIITDAEIFGWQRPEPRRRATRRAISPEDSYSDLEPGTIVVHVEYGIGRFEGLERRILSGAEREYLLLTYANDDLLYVPIYQADRLSRYVGPSDDLPALSRLGTPEWSRVKETTRSAVEEVAQGLLQLYAARELVVGHAFSSDGPWQHEVEASFPFVETADQLRALAEVKADMERPRPMDRLICGDVGYGKTEVALRAAFKAVMDSKQVAILVPTTILAQQHFDTFFRRLLPFPVKVEMLSRFKTHLEQDQIVQGLLDGTVDIVIGTHRLLGNDVGFNDLGLVIIDEEQRFGVAHKERLKSLRTQVDVLTLTATPIPRTLYMSLTGVRDISTIDTAPEERQPVITTVGRRDDDLIRQAIIRELDRDGQVYYVHNRVQTIFEEAVQLEKLVPQAKIAVGHGQMSEAALEAVMNQFTAGQIDVLVATSIIEAGLDIPNANTLIVNRADTFGLSQLHQLRGRVGRSANRAYAYFFHPSATMLTPDAMARLETIGEQFELGSGINIAMRDLEIRGTGDIVGTRQHGQIAAIGFHLYTQMLSQAVHRLRSERGEAVNVSTRTHGERLADEVAIIDLPMPTYIPTDYITDSQLRIQMYRRMANLTEKVDIDSLGLELQDRFGDLPDPVRNLLYQLWIRHLTTRAKATSVVAEGQQISIRIPGLAHVDRMAMQSALGHNVRVSRTAIWFPYVSLNDDDQWKRVLPEILEHAATFMYSES